MKKPIAETNSTKSVSKPVCKRSLWSDKASYLPCNSCLPLRRYTFSVSFTNCGVQNSQCRCCIVFRVDMSCRIESIVKTLFPEYKQFFFLCRNRTEEKTCCNCQNCNNLKVLGLSLIDILDLDCYQESNVSRTKRGQWNL